MSFVNKMVVGLSFLFLGTNIWLESYVKFITVTFLNNYDTHLHASLILLVSGHDSKQSDSEAPVMLELWGMQNTPS